MSICYYLFVVVSPISPPLEKSYPLIPLPAKTHNIPQSISFRNTKLSSNFKDDLSAANVRWLSELPDELDVFIAHRSFEEAIENIEKGKRNEIKKKN